MEVSGQLHAPAALFPEKNLATYWIGCWVGHRFGLEKRKISGPYRYSNPGPSSLYPSHYTEYTVPAPYTGQLDLMLLRYCAHILFPWM